MSVNKIIRETLAPFGFPCRPDVYSGNEKKYFVFNTADERGADFGDNRPGCTVTYVQVHLFFPLEENHLSLKKQVSEALFHAGFTYPSVQEFTLAEGKLKHIVYECSIQEDLTWQKKDLNT